MLTLYQSIFLVKYIVTPRMSVNPILPNNRAKSANCNVTNMKTYMVRSVKTSRDVSFNDLNILKEYKVIMEIILNVAIK